MWFLVGMLGRPSAEPSVQANMPSYLHLLDAGLERMAAGEEESAQALFEAASSAHPRDPLSYWGRGCVALAREGAPAAAPFFRRAAAFENAPAGALYGLGLCYLLTGHAETAREYLREALEQDPRLTSAWAYLALLETLSGERDQAQEYLQRAQGEESDPKLLEYLQVILDYHQGAWAKVVKVLQGRLAREKEDPPGHSPRLPLRLSFTESSALKLELVPSAPLPKDPAPLAEPSPPPFLPPNDRPYFQGLIPGQVVRGMQSLRVRLPAGMQPAYLTFSVDGQCLSVTNTRPYAFRWDATQVPEGPHTLTLRTEGGQVLEYNLEVIVQKQTPEPPPGYDPVAYQELIRGLGRLLKVPPPSYQVDLLLLHAYLRSGQYEEALGVAETIQARSWQDPEGLSWLLKLYALTGRSQPRDAVRQCRSGVPGGKRVALTFDDGPNIPFTHQLLELLAQYGARATFLVVGRRGQQFPYLLHEIAAQGHEIGNHSYSHRRMQGLSEEEVLLELLRTEWGIRQAGASPARLFRPPGGHSTPQVHTALARLGYTLLFWTLNGGDFKRFPPAEAARRMVERTTDGTIFLLHNGPDNSLEVLPHLLRGLRARGFRCVTASEILQPPDLAPPTRSEGGT